MKDKRLELASSSLLKYSTWILLFTIAEPSAVLSDKVFIDLNLEFPKYPFYLLPTYHYYRLK